MICPHRYVKPFIGADDKECEKGGMFYSLNNKLRQGVKEADAALAMEKEDRNKLIVEMQPSSEEEEEEEDESVEKMDFDRRFILTIGSRRFGKDKNLI